MTRKIIVIVLLVAMMFLLCGCDNSSDNLLAKKISNTKAYIKMDEKRTIIVDVDKYMIGSNGSIIVYGIDGKTYRTHHVNVVLVKDAEGR